MTGPVPPDRPTLEERLSQIRIETDFTCESTFRELMERLMPQAPTGADPRAGERNWHGKKIGDYEIVETIARGGMGVVFKARQVSLNRWVAIKMVLGGELATPDVLRRFLFEAEAAARLDHPAIVPVYEVGWFEGQPFYVMGFVEGESLSRCLRHGLLGSKQAARLLDQIAGGIQYAHDRGIVHRDLKPSNILLAKRSDHEVSGSDPVPSVSLDDVRPRIADFGLAASTMDLADRITATGQSIGTPSYMAPEQAGGKTQDPRLADVYSLGAILYAMLTGRPPFQSDTTLGTIQQVLACDPVPPCKLNATVHMDLQSICLKCLAKSAHRRYGSVAALRVDLQHFIAGEPVGARPAGKLEVAWSWVRRHPAIASLSLAAILLLVTLLTLFVANERLSVARARSSSLEQTVILRETERDAAQQVAAAQQRVAMTERYYAASSRIHELLLSTKAGWSSQAEEELESVARLPRDIVEEVEERNLRAACRLGIDLRMVAEVRFESNDIAYLPKFHPRGDRLAVAMLKDRLQIKVNVVEVPSGQILHRLHAPAGSGFDLDGVRRIAWLEGGEVLAVTTRIGRLLRWDMRGESPQLTAVPLPYGPIDSDRFAFDEAGNRAFLAIGNELHRWDDFDSSQTLGLGDYEIDRLTVSRDGRWLAINDLMLDTRDNRITSRMIDVGRNVDFSPDHRFVLGEGLFDMRSGLRLGELVDPATGSMHEDAITDVTFSPSGAFFLTGGHDHQFKLWESSTRRPLLHEIIPEAAEVRAVFGPDDHHVAAVGGNRLRIYELTGISHSTTRVLSIGPILDFDVAVNVGLVATVAPSRGPFGVVVALWELSSGQMLDHWVVPGFQNVPSTVALAADGTSVVVCNYDKIHRWKLDPSGIRQLLQDSPAHHVAIPLRAVFHDDRWTPLVEGYPAESLPIADWGLDWKRVDAGINWGNGLAYLFAGDQYAALDVATMTILPGFPREIKADWPGLWPGDIDSAMMNQNGYAYFFRGNEYMRVNADTRTMNGKYPKPISAGWKGIFSDRVDAIRGFEEIDQSLLFVRDAQAFKRDRDGNLMGPIPLTQFTRQETLPARADAIVDTDYRRSPHYVLKPVYQQSAVRHPSCMRLSIDEPIVWVVEDDLQLSSLDLETLRRRDTWHHVGQETGVGVGTITGYAVHANGLLTGSKNGVLSAVSKDSMSSVHSLLTDQRIVSVWATDSKVYGVWGSEEGHLGWVSLPDLKRGSEWIAHSGGIRSIVGDREGAVIWTGSQDGSVKKWRWSEDQFTHELTLSFPKAIRELMLLEDRVLVVSLMGENALRFVQTDQH